MVQEALTLKVKYLELLHSLDLYVRMARNDDGNVDVNNIIDGNGCNEEQAVGRGPYNKVSQVDRDRLVAAFRENRDWVTLAKNLNIKRQTARNIILKYRRSGSANADRRGGNKPKKIDDEMLAYLLARI